MRNILKEKLARGEKPLGTFVGTGSAAVVECLGCAGLDFVILDNEHSPIEAETTARLVCAAERRNITPLARVREISRPAILKLLDVGVQGIIIPDVHSAGDHYSRCTQCGGGEARGGLRQVRPGGAEGVLPVPEGRLGHRYAGRRTGDNGALQR